MALKSPYEDLTPETIKARMLADLGAKEAVSIAEGSYANTLVSVAAYELYKMYQSFPRLLYMAFPDETAGEYIDMAAAQIGMHRETGSKASVQITVTGDTGAVVPEGTELYAPGDGLRYVTKSAVTLSGGRGTVAAEAVEVGNAYNLPAHHITALVANLRGITGITNDSPAEGGADPESDADFFARYHRRLSLPITSGNKNHYIQWALETVGVSYANCIPLWNGNGTVKVVVGGDDRGPVDESVRARCAAHIEDNRPIGATVTAVSVHQRKINLAARITLVPGGSTQQVKAQLTALVSELLAAQPFGQQSTIPYSRFLACLLRCDGVADYSSFTVEGKTGAVVIQGEESPVVGTVQVN